MNYFYSPSLDVHSTHFLLEPEESRHIVKVLRRQVGDILHITNGLGMLFEAELLDANPKKCSLQVLSCTSTSKPKPEIHLAVAPTKRVERFQWLLEKSTEIGIARITPILCDRSERTNLPVDRLKRVVQEAMKQSLQTWMPELTSPVPFSSYLNEDLPHQRLIAHCEPDQKQHLMEVVTSAQDTVILIGPEGDFTPQEIALARSKNFKPVSLGSNRLRTETAAMVACSALNLLNPS